MRKVKLTNNRLTEPEILDIVKGFQMDKELYARLEAYYDGFNVAIQGTRPADSVKDSPNNKISVPYGRKIINTIVGYEFTPGSASFKSKNEGYVEQINAILKDNKGDIKTSYIGRHMANHGLANVMFYTQSTGDSAEVKFVVMRPTEIIPLYDYSIEPKLACFIRLYNQVENGNETELIELHYSDMWIRYQVGINDKSEKQIVKIDEGINLFGVPELVVFKNTDDFLSDLQPVLKLIDAYDVLTSESMNEFERFAGAYLLLAGQGMDESEAAKIKARRFFENLESTDAVRFLTKDINAEYIKYLTDLIQRQIHTQSGVPDIENLNFGSSPSGTALDSFIYMMEFVAAPKEAFFRDGLIQMIQMIHRLPNYEIILEGEPDELQIVMTRNKPASETQDAEIYERLYGKGIDTPRLIAKYMAWIEDPQQAFEDWQEETESMAPDLDEIEPELPEETEEDIEEEVE